MAFDTNYIIIAFIFSEGVYIHNFLFVHIVHTVNWTDGWMNQKFKEKKQKDQNSLQTFLNVQYVWTSYILNVLKKMSVLVEGTMVSNENF